MVAATGQVSRRDAVDGSALLVVCSPSRSLRHLTSAVEPAAVSLRQRWTASAVLMSLMPLATMVSARTAPTAIEALSLIPLPPFCLIADLVGLMRQPAFGRRRRVAQRFHLPAHCSVAFGLDSF